MLLAPRRLQQLQQLLRTDQDMLRNDLQVANIVLEDERERKKKKQRRWWVRPWLIRRPLFGQYERLMGQLRVEDTASFKNFVRVDPEMFDELTQRIGPRIQRQNTKWRQALDPGLKMAITLRYLATGDSYHSLMYGFRVAHNTISKVVKEVCDAIVAEYAQEVIMCPTTESEWREVAELFERRWNFPHCLGALDGKHVAVRKPRKGGSLYWNYKGYNSIIMLALVDGDYKFLWVNIGAMGSCSDCQVFNHSELKELMDDGKAGVPPPEPLPYDDRECGWYIVGDDAFPLKPWLMKPYCQRQLDHDRRIFNYRLSRARRISENAFGILANRFGCLLTFMKQQPDQVTTITEACVCLHNLMRTRYPGQQNAILDKEDNNHQWIPGAWREGRDMDDILRAPQGRNRDSQLGKMQREYLKDYFNSEVGSLPWQEAIILPPRPIQT